MLLQHNQAHFEKMQKSTVKVNGLVTIIISKRNLIRATHIRPS